ncbi:hypothetical protein NsoK4_01735 [Nitrosopumilus sp. K4]|uniref:hypothetical protein n=1 Tax=Nitrosopumilus sp. K4 TaxID=2795383 RepID=UPI001BADFA80|nr:hypothetical protein [Nitrosopumilus sp. K4]QUC65022.1 hypothetical protein NsoK4_01735 [Nitrosopumilus sp. K4]
MSVKPKHFSEIFQDAPSLAKAITKVSNHELIACGKCNEPIRIIREQEHIQHPTWDDIVVKFCTKCGTEIDWSKSENNQKECKKCSLNFDVNESFCIHCGDTLTIVPERKDGEF